MIDLRDAIKSCQSARTIMQRYRWRGTQTMSKGSAKQTASELITLQEEVRILLEDFQSIRIAE